MGDTRDGFTEGRHVLNKKDLHRRRKEPEGHLQQRWWQEKGLKCPSRTFGLYIL